MVEEIRSRVSGSVARPTGSFGKIITNFTFLCLILTSLLHSSDAAPASGGDDKYGDDYYDGGIFGSMADTDIFIGSSSMLIVIIAVLVVENIFHLLEHMAHDTPFQDMVLAIEKELMIVGTMAFILKLIITTSDFLDYDWYHALEFADTVVPCTAFMVAVIGIFLILQSILVCKLWIRAYHLHLFELLDEYYIKSGHWVHAGWLSWLPISVVNAEMEFRIFHSIFCEQYNIQRKAFAFDEFTYLKFEKFLLKVLKIQEVNWFYIMIVVGINWLRYYLNWDMHSCVVNEDHSYKCQGKASINGFIYIGLAMVVIMLILAIVSRIYEIRLMATRGITNSDDYALYLQTFEDTHSDDAPEEKVKLSEADLKKAVEISKNYKDDVLEHESASYFNIDDLYSNGKEFLYGLIGIKGEAPILPDYTPNKFSNDSDNEKVKRGFLDGNHPAVDTSGDKYRASPLKEPVPPAINTSVGTPGASGGPISPNIPGLSEAMKARTKALVKNRVQINKNHEAEVIQEEVPYGLTSKENFSGIFFFGAPKSYFYAVQTMIMFIAFYLALWICNFLTVSYVIAQGDESVRIRWVIYSLLPGVVSSMLYMYCVKVAALLQSVTEIDTDAMLEIIEQTEGTRYLGTMMRSRMLDKLRDMGNPEQELKVLFMEIDDNNSNLLSRREFQIFLEALGITFSRKKWSQIFVEIDLNNDDEISFRELFLFLFPDNDAARLEEARRLARIGMRVRDHAEKITGNIDPNLTESAKKRLTMREKSNLQIKKALDRELKATVEHDVLQEIEDENELM